MTILITNDDGYRSWGLNTLYRATKEVFGNDIVVVVPEGYQSSTGMSFTFHKPLRVEKLVYEKMPCLAISGTPSDCVFMALNYLFKNKITMVLSGVNNGMNAGMDAIYSSGTVSAAMCAAIFKIKSAAFSKDLWEESLDTENKKEMDKVFPKLVYILNIIKNKGFPKGVELLNVNFPKELKKSTKIKIVRAERSVFENAVQKEKDPRGKEYYWLYGTLKKNLDKIADLAALLNGNITVTPIKLFASGEKDMSDVRSMFYDSKT
jgi:5'-nucleotidase